MTQPFLPPVTGLVVSGGNLVATLADGTTSTLALPASGSAAAATSASTSVTASTVTTSYSRPLSDFTGEIVHVVSFIPAGTTIGAVTDWGPIWNAALAECRAIVSAGRQFHLIGPGCTQVVSTTINMTDLGWPVGSATATPFGSQVDFNNATIYGKTFGAAIIDAMNTWFLRISNLTLNGVNSSGSMPTIGFQHGRVIVNSNADTLQFDNVFFTGYYSFTGYYNLASESLSFLSGWLSNACALANATGVVSLGTNTTGVAPTAVSGAAKVCYAAVLDGLNHWQVPHLSQLGKQSGNTPFPPETLVSFEEATFLNVTFSANGPAIWMSHCASPRFIRCYANSGSGTSMIDIYRMQNDDFDDAEFDIHFESFGSTPPVCTFQLLGPAYQFVFADGFLFRDSGTYATTSVFKLAGSNAPTVNFQDIDIKLSKVLNGTTNTTTATLFDTPASYSSNGSITCPAAVYNGVNHTGRLNLGGAITEVGNVVFGGSIAPATLTTALAGAGINIVSDSVQSVTMTGPGNYYSGTGTTSGFAVTVTFPTPPGGTAATGTPQLGCAGLGIVSGAAGTGYANNGTNLAATDATGATLPFSVNTFASGGALTAVYFNTPATPFSTVPPGPYTVVQSGASGGQFYADFTVKAVRMLTGGSGYQTDPSPIAPSFSGTYPAAGTVVMAAAVSVNAFNVAAGQKIGLDTAGTMWVEEDANGKVVIGTGTTRLFSIDASGNVLAKGTITASTTV